MKPPHRGDDKVNGMPRSRPGPPMQRSPGCALHPHWPHLASGWLVLHAIAHRAAAATRRELCVAGETEGRERGGGHRSSLPVVIVASLE
jgi:hypothetical protein